MNDAAVAAYLRDHATGAGAVIEVVRRRIDQGRGPAFLPTFLAELDQELEALERLHDQLDSGGSGLRKALGWAAEKVGQVKLVADAQTDEALRDLLELELMTVGVEGKRRLWISLQQLDADARVAALDLTGLHDQAERQIQQLETARRSAAADLG